MEYHADDIQDKIKLKKAGQKPCFLRAAMRVVYSTLFYALAMSTLTAMKLFLPFFDLR